MALPGISDFASIGGGFTGASGGNDQFGNIGATFSGPSFPAFGVADRGAFSNEKILIGGLVLLAVLIVKKAF